MPADDYPAFAARFGLPEEASDALRTLVEAAVARAQATWSGPTEADARPADEPPRPLSRYADRGLLGRGGMGEVRQVWDHQLDRPLAMKLLHPDLQLRVDQRDRFEREARVLARLQHPGVVPVHEMGQRDDGRFYFTMREVRGDTLAQRLQDSSWSLRRRL